MFCRSLRIGFVITLVALVGYPIAASASTSRPAAIFNPSRVIDTHRVVGFPNIPLATHTATPHISNFVATPSSLPIDGGKVTLGAVVKDGLECTFTSTRTIAALPSRAKCTNGSEKVLVRVPKNTSRSTKIYKFELQLAGTAKTTVISFVSVKEAPKKVKPATAPLSDSTHSPLISGQPSNDSVVAGNSASFSASASGTPTPNVQWQLSTNSGGTWVNVSGATLPTYSFTAAASQNGYEYEAVFTNSAGSATTNTAILTVTTAPFITNQPTGQSVNAGDTANFTAGASGTPTPTMQWLVSTDNGNTWSNVSGATLPTYSFTAAASQNGYEYEAVFTNSAGSATTNTAILTVASLSSPIGGGGGGGGGGGTTPAAPAITTQPVNDSVTAGSTASFTAGASGTPTPSVQWQVSPDNGNTWANAPGTSTSTTYSFTASSSQNGYEYEAVFTNAAGSTITNAATLTVGVANTAPTITTQPTNDSVTAGSTASFTAGASGTPTPSVQWQVSIDSGNTWANASGTSTSTTYSFTASSSQNGYEYEAVFTNAAGSATTNAVTLTVNTAPTITTQPTNDSVTAGSTASFTAGASGTPTPTVQWQVSIDSGNTWANAPGTSTSTTYSFTTSSQQNGYEYEAVFTNAAGSTITNAATLTVGIANTAPTITTQPTNDSVTAGSTASFTAGASGTPTPTVQWLISTNGGNTWASVPGATSTTYSFTTSSSQNGYEYEAVFTNAAGSTITNAATLTVATGPAMAQSSNWSGYIDSGSTFDAVNGEWTVPAVSCPSGVTDYSSQWIGIDGATDQTVEQDGTSSDCSSGTPTYYAWVEMFGDSNFFEGNEAEIQAPVSPGDLIIASVNVSGNNWTLVVTDVTQNWRYTSPAITFSANETSAEWIVERPEVNNSISNLANFGSATMSAATATALNGPTGSISSFTNEEIEMTDQLFNVLALPGALSDLGEQFSDTWQASS